MTLSSIRDSLVWAPEWLWGVAVLLIAAICALIAHRLIFMRAADGEPRDLSRRPTNQTAPSARFALPPISGANGKKKRMRRANPW
jgi:hypothetical protein